MQAASELAGWTRPSADGDVGTGGVANPNSGGSYPSALMQEARGPAPRGSFRRQLQPKQESGVAGGAAPAKPDGGDAAGAAVVGGSRRLDGRSVGGTTRRWGYRRGPREQLRRNLFGRFAPVFFYPLVQVRIDCLSCLTLNAGRVASVSLVLTRGVRAW